MTIKNETGRPRDQRRCPVIAGLSLLDIAFELASP
jgi:hypothetical protein